MNRGAQDDSTRAADVAAAPPPPSNAISWVGDLFGGFDFRGLLAIADSLPVMVAYIDANRIYRFVNKPLADWFDRPRCDILGKAAHEIMSAETYADRKPRLDRALAGERQQFEAPFDHESRGLRCIEADYVPHVTPDGVVRGITLVVQDITEQRAAEIALRESEQRFRRIADSAPVPMWVIGARGVRDFANHAFLDFFGITEEDIVDFDWQSVLHPDERDEFTEKFLDAMRAHQRIELMVRVRKDENEWRWWRVVSAPRIDIDGRIIGFTGAANDVTEAREAELALQRQVDEKTADLEAVHDQLRQAQKMEALGQLTGGIAHDFNNLLTVVVGSLDMVAKHTDDPKVQRYATNALAAAERGARLTAQLLAFSRVQRLEVKPIYVAPLIEELRPLLRNVLGPGVEKRLDFDSHLKPVMADPTQLEVAVLNLVINARDAMPDGGILTIKTRHRRIEGDPELEDGDYIVLSIHDTGTGMSEETRRRAFEPFFTTKDVGKGTGLGLSMVYGMARQSGGTARIDSKEGEGTTVTLYFRHASGEEPANKAGSGERDKSTVGSVPFKILVIDDDPDVRSFVTLSLDELGHDVTEAADGFKGLEAFRAERPDLVILDYVMPGMSGADIAEHIRSEIPDQPILFVSGYSETDAIKAAAPDAPILSKPFKPAALDEAVRGIMESRKNEREGG